MIIRYALALFALLCAGPGAAQTCSIQRQPVNLQLPDFVSAAEFVMPPRATHLRAVLVLFPGSDVADMDGAIGGAGGVVISRPMRQVAERLACAGFASFRYNKRHVTGPLTVDRAKFDALNGVDFAADGRSVLAYLRARPVLAKLPVGLVGWSEGTTVAMAVAADEPSVRAMVLMAPVVEPPARIAQAQYGRIGRPYLMQFATDNALDSAAIARAETGRGGDLARIFVRMFKGFRPGEKVNPLFDTNGDGRITFAEADPVIMSWYGDGPGSGLGMSSTARALKGVADTYSATTPPLLILQGLNDSMIDPGAALSFASRSAADHRVSLITYPGLGHSFARTSSAQEDNLLPVEAKVLNDMTTWLKRTFK